MFEKMEGSLEVMTCKNFFFTPPPVFVMVFSMKFLCRCYCGQSAALHESSQDQKKSETGWDPNVNITVRKCDSFGEILFRDILTGIKKNSMVRKFV